VCVCVFLQLYSYAISIIGALVTPNPFVTLLLGERIRVDPSTRVACIQLQRKMIKEICNDLDTEKGSSGSFPGSLEEQLVMVFDHQVGSNCE